MKYAPLVKRIAGKGSRAWDIHTIAQQRHDKGEDVIVLSVGDPDFDTPAPIVEAAIDSLQRGRHHYTPSVGIPELRETVARNHQQATGQNVSADNVAILQGAQNALMSVALCVLDQDDEVIIPEPMYVTYEGVIGTCGAKLIDVALRPEDGFQVDPSSIEAAITPNSRALLLNTPHNPTGAVLKHDVLEEIADICRRHDLWVISDEVYATITYDAEHISPCSFPGMAERTVTISSLSKSHAMTGWRLGWAIGPTELIHHIDTLSNSMLYGSPPFIQDAAVHALNHEIEELDKMNSAYRRRRDRVCAELESVEGLSIDWPEGGMFAMADVRQTGLSSQKFMELLYERESVSVLAGSAFGPSGAGHVRISLAASEAVLTEGCKRIARFVASLKGD